MRKESWEVRRTRNDSLALISRIDDSRNFPVSSISEVGEDDMSEVRVVEIGGQGSSVRGDWREARKRGRRISERV